MLRLAFLLRDGSAVNPDCLRHMMSFFTSRISPVQVYHCELQTNLLTGDARVDPEKKQTRENYRITYDLNDTTRFCEQNKLSVGIRSRDLPPL